HTWSETRASTSVKRTISYCPTLEGAFGSSTTRTKSHAPSRGLPVTSRIAPSLRFTLAPTGRSRKMRAALLPSRSLPLLDSAMTRLLGEEFVVDMLIHRVEILPAFGFHEGQPAAKAGSGWLLRHPEVEGKPRHPVVGRPPPDPHLEVVGQPPGHRPLAGREDVVPVLHVVGFGQAGRPAVAHHVMALGVLHRFGRLLVHLEQAPALGDAHPMGLPGQDAPMVDDHVRKDGKMPAAIAVARHDLFAILLLLRLVGLAVVLVHAGLLPRVDIVTPPGLLVKLIGSPMAQLVIAHGVVLRRELGAHGAAVRVSLALGADGRGVDGAVGHGGVRRVGRKAK